VGLLLAGAGCSEEVVIAGILHDTLEDTDLDPEVIRREFGEAVLAIVRGCTEPAKSVPWEERKRHTLHLLETTSDEIRLVSCADKLHNVRSMGTDRERLGEGVWAKFKRGREQQAWYYRGLVAALCREPLPEPGAPLFHALRVAVEALFGPAQRGLRPHRDCRL
jgi:(p)ppGpp synthase/HD superfamily hydrolase